MTKKPQQDVKITERDTTLNPRQLRAAGYVPATLYGKGIESRSVQVKAHEFQHLYEQGVREFQISGPDESKAIAWRVQYNALSQKPISIQFLLRNNGAA